MKDEECVYYLDSSKCDSNDCHGCVARLKENKRKYHDKEIREKAIEEFSEQIKARANSMERNDWSADYMISIWESVIDEIAMELKGE